MSIVIAVLTGAGVAAGVALAVAVVVAMAAGGRAAGAGRAGDRLLVAPRGAGFGTATRMVVEATREEAAGHAAVVHLDEHRAARSARRHHAA